MPTLYLLTNESMPDIVNIGVTEDLPGRIKQLDNTSVALPSKCFYAVEINQAHEIETKLHAGLTHCRVRQQREFFAISPHHAKSLLEVAEILGGRKVTHSDDPSLPPDDRLALSEAHKSREAFSFDMIDLGPGTELYFKDNSQVTCTVIDEQRVEFLGKITSLSASALEVLREQGTESVNTQGSFWWCLDGKSVHDWREVVAADHNKASSPKALTWGASVTLSPPLRGKKQLSMTLFKVTRHGHLLKALSRPRHHSPLMYLTNLIYLSPLLGLHRLLRLSPNPYPNQHHHRTQGLWRHNLHLMSHHLSHSMS